MDGNVTQGQKIRAMLEEVGWSGRDLARRCGVNERTERRWEADEAQMPPEWFARLEYIAIFLRQFPKPWKQR